MGPWERIGIVKAERLREARLEAHWAAQLVAATGDAVLTHAADDSHSNMRWDRRHAALLGQPLGGGIRIGLRIFPLAVVVVGPRAVEERPLLGSSLASAEDWLSSVAARVAGQPGVRVRHRDYPMPAHPVSQGAAFACRDGEAFGELARWYANADDVLAEIAGVEPNASPVAVWPHHFDAGAIVFLDADAPPSRARQVGFGLSPGDEHIAEPYFNVTAWPLPAGARIEGLAAGRWFTTGFTGAVLEASEVGAAADAAAQRALAAEFLRTAIAAGKALLRASAAGVGGGL